MNFDLLKDYIDKIVSETNTPCADIIVYKEHKEIFRYFSGYSDVENGKKIKGDELYLIYSMTKMITCVCALQLFEKGKFLMSDPVSKYMPEFSKMRITKNTLDIEAAKNIISGNSIGEKVENSDDGFASNPITIKHLFTMTAGLDYDLYADGIKKALADGKKSTREVVGAMSDTVLGFEPGTRYRYSLCHDVLGALIEIWSGEKFGDYLRKNLLEPLGMKNTFFGVPKDKERLSKMAALYREGPDGERKRLELICEYNLSDEYESGGAGLVSCTEDYAVFLDALANGGMGKNEKRILSAATVELMGTNHLDGQAAEDFDNMRNGYGYGLGVRTHINKVKSGSLSPVGEFGWDGAAGGFSMVDTKNKLSLTYFQHSRSWDLRNQTEMRNILYSSLDE